MMFVLIYLALYGAMCSYMFWKFHRAFAGHAVPPMVWYAFAAFLAMMMVLPVVIRMLDRAGYVRLASPTAPYLFSWLAIAFWFVCAGLVLDLWNVLARGLAHFAPAYRLQLAPMPNLLVIVSAVAVAMIVGMISAQRIGLTTLTVKSPHLPAGSKPIRVVQISDLHLGGGTGRGRLEKIVELIDQAKPDLIVGTGDIVDGEESEIGPLARILARTAAPLGKIAVPGNHEYYVGIEQSKVFYQAAGFRLLRHETMDITPNLRIVGADDTRSLYFDENKRPKVAPLLDGHGAFNLLLVHRPEIEPETIGRFDLQLSGHTHGGQIFPFTLFVHMMYKYDRGLFDLGGGSKLYVNKGAGTWGPPMRLFSDPEVTLISLEPAE